MPIGRPHYHFTPAQNWMNDPNGLVYFQGEYHLHFQHNPLGLTPGNIGWGHAVSPDLLHWHELGLAIPYQQGIAAFSGSALVDWQNASGFGALNQPPLVAVFTGHRDQERIEDQRLAYSTDAGRNWNLFVGNPVLDILEKDFRDPKVFWHAPSQRFVMLVVLAHECKVCFYGSSDLQSWQRLSTFGPAGASASLWEVPELFELALEGSEERRWVLKVDVGQDAPFGGSGGQYFVGHFDGETFTPLEDTASPNWLEYGKDFYAAITCSDLPDDRCIWLGWMNNWQYAQVFPTQPWRGAMTIPRALSLRDDGQRLRLVQRPIAELEGLRGTHQRLTHQRLDSESRALEVNGPAYEIIVRFQAGNAIEFGIELGEFARVGYEPSAQLLFVERHGAWVSEHFPGRHGHQVALQNGVLELRIFIDTVSVEVFAEDGATVITDLIMPNERFEAPRIYAQHGSAELLELDIWSITKTHSLE